MRFIIEIIKIEEVVLKIIILNKVDKYKKIV